MKKIKVFDTTLRDGEQSPGCSMNLMEKIEMAKQLDRLGVDVIEAGFAISSPMDFKSVQTIAANVTNCKVASLARCTKVDIDAAWGAVKEAKYPVLHVFLATSDIHLEYKLQQTREEVLQSIRENVAFRLAEKRRKKVCSVDKANVLATSRPWRRVVTEVAAQYPTVELSHMYVDNCAMQIIRAPHQFDVIVTENLFGDILSDEASIIGGSIGLIPSASMGSGTLGVYEPIHGSAPDIAGTDAANPIGTILAAAELLRNSFDMMAEAKAIEDAVDRVLDQGYRCGDIMSEGMTKVGCKEMGRRIVEAI